MVSAQVQPQPSGGSHRRVLVSQLASLLLLEDLPPPRAEEWQARSGFHVCPDSSISPCRAYSPVTLGSVNGYHYSLLFITRGCHPVCNASPNTLSGRAACVLGTIFACLGAFATHSGLLPTVISKLFPPPCRGCEVQGSGCRLWGFQSYRLKFYLSVFGFRSLGWAAGCRCVVSA